MYEAKEKTDDRDTTLEKHTISVLSRTKKHTSTTKLTQRSSSFSFSSIFFSCICIISHRHPNTYVHTHLNFLSLLSRGSLFSFFLFSLKISHAIPSNPSRHTFSPKQTRRGSRLHTRYIVICSTRGWLIFYFVAVALHSTDTLERQAKKSSRTRTRGILYINYYKKSVFFFHIVNFDIVSSPSINISEIIDQYYCINTINSTI